jgi:prepilin-type N-terminal cleavage/methylation domain-containing protein
MTDNRGFTLAELLIVIAVIAALLAVGVIGVVQMQKKQRQMELDRLAENLYSAAQNQLTLRAATYGADDLELLGAAKIVDDEKNPVCYASYNCAGLSTTGANAVLPAGSISGDLQSSSYGWVVQFNPRSHSVGYVFVVDSKGVGGFVTGYGDGTAINANLTGDPDTRRTSYDSTVGYYSGNLQNAAESKETGDLACLLMLDNAEKLSGELFVKLPGVPADSEMLNKTLSLDVTMTVTGKSSGKSVTLPTIHYGDIKLDVGNNGKWLGKDGTVLSGSQLDGDGNPVKGNGFIDTSAVFDSLESGKHFSERFTDFTPGEDITVKATVECKSEDVMVSPASDEDSANSLFANGSSALVKNGTARVEFARHLQNLNAVTTNTEGFNAMQIADINMDDATATSWHENYGSKGVKFQPIKNPYLTAYNAGYKDGGENKCHVISNLTVNGDGLFETFYGELVSRLELNNCAFTGADAAGMIGASTKELKLYGCTLNKCSATAGEDDGVAGGLVGTAGGKLTVCDCKSDGVSVTGGSAAGGFVGVAADELLVKNFDRENTPVKSANVEAKNGVAGGIVGEAQQKAALENCLSLTENDKAENDEDKAFITGSQYAGGLVGSASDELTASDCQITLCEIRGGASAEAAGALVGHTAGDLNAQKCEIIDSTVCDAKAVGGFVGSAESGNVKLSECGLYMKELLKEEDLQSKSMKWMSGSEYAGGLIGLSNKPVEIEKSFAATVVKAKFFAGGLVGGTTAKLTVKSSYADCYIGCQGMLGGLAGSCGNGSSFTSCYSAGFVFGGVGGANNATKAAGFVPAKADVKDCYTIFCFDDGMHCVTQPGGTEKVPKALTLSKKYAFTSDGSCTNAYYVFTKDVTAAAGAQHITGENLEKQTIAGFTNGKKPSNAYKLTELTQDVYYSYPTNGLDHYNDFYAVSDDGKDVKVYTVSMLGTDAASLEFKVGDKSQSATVSDYKMVTPYDTYTFDRKNQGEVFVGWLYLKDDETMTGETALSKLGLNATQAAELCGKLDLLTIDKGNAKFAYADVTGVFESYSLSADAYLLTYTLTGDSEKEMTADIIEAIRTHFDDQETPVLYALYREVIKNVKIEYRRFDLSAFATGMSGNIPTALNTTVTEKKYLGSGSTILEDNLVFNPLLEEDTVRKLEIHAELETQGYHVVDSDYLKQKYGEVSGYNTIVSAAGFLKDGTHIENDGKGHAIYDKDESDKSVLYCRIDGEYTYAVLCDGSMITVPVKFEFRDAVTNSTTAEADGASAQKDVAQLKDLETYIKEHVTYQSGKKLTLQVDMALPLNEVLWADLPELKGFELLKDDIKNAFIDPDNLKPDPEDNTKKIYDPEKYPVVPYKWIVYTLAFDLNGGIYSTYDPADHSKISTVTTKTSLEMHINESLKDILPVSEAAKDKDAAFENGYVSRPSQRLETWEFYDLASYDPNNAESRLKSIPVNQEETEDGGLGRLTEDYLMPTQSVMVRATWKEVTEVPIRVEVYVQNVTDKAYSDYNAGVKTADAAKTYAFYRAFDTDGKKDLNDYKNLTYVEVLQKAFNEMPAADRVSLLNEIKTRIDDDREYMLSPVASEKYTEMEVPTGQVYTYYKYVGSKNGDYERHWSFSGYYYTYVGPGKGNYIKVEEPITETQYLPNVDGTIKNKQFVYNSYWSNNKTTGKGDAIAYTIDATGTAVFKVYYDRQIDTFTFETGSSTRERFVKQHKDPGSTNGFSLIPVTWSNGRYYEDYRGTHCTVYLLRDNLIDDNIGSNRFSSGDFERAETWNGRGIITINGNTYIFARYIDYDYSYYYGQYIFYYVPFYDSGDLAAAYAAGYKWMNDANYQGLYSPLSESSEIVITGLYEQDLNTAWKYQKNDDGVKWEWPGNGKTNWKVTAGGKTIYSNLSFVDSFYYYRWIRNSGTDKAATQGETQLIFTKNGTDSENKIIRFYQEKPNVRNAGTDPVETNFNNGDDYQDIQYVSSGGFNLNDKYAGFSLYAYKVDKGRFNTSVENGKNVSFSSSLDIFFARNTYQVNFENVRNCPAQSYLYEQTLTSLPDVAANEAKYRPSGSTAITAEHHFRGWFTESNGGGKEVYLKKVFENVYEVRYKDSDESVKMPAGGLTLFAYWTADNVEISFYSRLPGTTNESVLLTEAELRDGVTVPKENATLYQQIPASVFDRIYARWAHATTAGTYSLDTSTGERTFKTNDGKTYRFDGWYRTPSDDVPSYTERLQSRFFEGEYITKAHTFQLAGQWTQTSGSAPYHVICTLLDADGNVTKKIEKKDFGTAEVGREKDIQAPNVEQIPELEGYYPLTPVIYVEEFKAEENTFEFRYRIAEPWEYTVNSAVTLRDETNANLSQSVTFRSVEKKPVKDNDYAYIDNIDGFILDPANQEVKNVMRSDADKTVTYTYSLDKSSIQFTTNVSWKKGSSVITAPHPLSFSNGVGNKLESLDEGWTIQEVYSIAGKDAQYTSMAELIRKGNDGDELDAGNYTVNVTLELWHNGAKYLTIYHNSTTLRIEPNS